jgi:hypothetical protein
MRRVKFPAKLLMRIPPAALLSCVLACSFTVVAAQPGDFPNRATEELSDLREGTTLSEWMRVHPTDILTVYSHEVRDWGTWVARAIRREKLSDGRELLRHAYFYVPLPPDDRKLPGGNSKKLREQSQLGMIWIQSIESNVQAGEKLAEQTREVLSRRFSQGQYDLKVWYANAAYWKKTAQWNVGQTTFVSAYELLPIEGPNRGRVLTFSFLPVSGVHVDLGSGDDGDEEGCRGSENFLDAAIAASGLRGKRLEPMRLIKEMVAEYRAGKSHQWTSAVDDQTAQLLKQWLIASRRLKSSKRAAGLLAADRALEMSEWLGQRQDETVRKKLEALGAKFNYSKLGDSYVYTNSWLKQSLRVGRHGKIGQWAFVLLMEKGFDTSGTCSDTGDEAFRRVIFEGEQFLKRVRDPKLQNRVHLLVAEAYSDIVALADGAGDGYAEAAKYQKSAARARRKAIEHYRRALTQIANPSEANRVWRKTWRLKAGVPPTGTRFFCVYD